MAFTLMIATVVGVMPFGWLADRIGPKRVVFIGFGLLTLAALCALWINTLTQVMVVMIIAGLGNAGQAASAYPLLTNLVPVEEVGFYTGFQSTMLSIAQPVTVVITGLLINHASGSYRVVFLVCALTILAAMAVLTAVHEKDSPAEIAARNRAQGREG
jgi:MFS family permease